MIVSHAAVARNAGAAFCTVSRYRGGDLHRCAREKPGLPMSAQCPTPHQCSSRLLVAQALP